MKGLTLMGTIINKNENPPFQTKIYLVKVPLNVSIVRYWLKIVSSKRRHFNFHW